MCLLTRGVLEGIDAYVFALARRDGRMCPLGFGRPVS